ncbi:nuclear transport factor 2 family protein [Streptomyces sp. ADMS]|uniref:nuclear transport factor 2 family protein n=1 Tax=Streptomyces sp. ADMS TaxID=3071415 RepID=UPI00296FF527|nr:nuclear transport factor 2 family protein [Streptomyces sp. ADMS]MDW4911305.1 nuclear transport factor 2 family protein [Streptomyces sp. ADMS]
MTPGETHVRAPHSAAATVARRRAAAKRGDVDSAVACVSRDVVLSSPLTEQFRFEGPDQLCSFMTSAFTAVEDIRSHTRTGDGDVYALFYRARVGSQPFEDAQLLRLDDEARIKEITLFGRPVQALTALMMTLGPELARRGLAAHMRASASPVHTMVTFGDRRVVPLTRPAARRTRENQRSSSRWRWFRRTATPTTCASTCGAAPRASRSSPTRAAQAA